MSTTTSTRIQIKKRLSKLLTIQLQGHLIGVVEGFFEGVVKGLEKTTPIEEGEKKELTRISQEIVRKLESKVGSYEFDMITSIEKSIIAFTDILDTI